MFERQTSAMEVNHRRWKRGGCRGSEPVMGVRKQVNGRSNSAARDWSQESSLSWSSSRKQTAAWFPLKADSVNASTCYSKHSLIFWRKLWKEKQTKRRRRRKNKITTKYFTGFFMIFLGFLLIPLNVYLYSATTQLFEKNVNNVASILNKRGASSYA